MPPDDPLGFVRADLGIKCRRPIGQTDLDDRRLVAHADAADAFDRCVDAEILYSPAQEVEQFVAALRHAAGAEADADLCAVAVAVPGDGVHIGDRFVPGCAEIIHHFRDRVRGQVAVCHVVELDDRRQRAATEAGDALDGELVVRTRVVAAGDPELPADVIVDVFRAFDVAGGAVADPHRVPSGFSHPELVVERRHADQVGKPDAGRLTDAP